MIKSQETTKWPRWSHRGDSGRPAGGGGGALPKRKEAVPAQGSPAESGMSYYTPKASASQGSAAQPAGDEDGPYRVAVYDGKIGVFRQGEAEPFLTADVEVYLLPQEDIALLRAGLEADTLAEVKAILEDYQ